MVTANRPISASAEIESELKLTLYASRACLTASARKGTHENVAGVSVVVSKEEGADWSHVRLVLRPSCFDQGFVGVDRRCRVI
jgi:hypothetical protein